MFSGTRPAPARYVRLVPRAAVAVVAALVLAACGGGTDNSTSDSTSSAASDAGKSAAFPVTVAHKYGSTTIDEEPEKVVTLGLSDQDAVLALGVKPVGAVDWFKERPYGKWPWAKELWGSDAPEIVGERDEYNMEKIAALKPDLVIAQYSGMKKEQYDTLSRFTKVVAQPEEYDDYAAPWEVMTRQIGKALGKEDQTEKLISDIDAQFKAVRDEHPEFADLTLAVADSFEAGKYSAFTKGDPKAIFFTELGFTLKPEIDKLAKPGWNVAELSAEKLNVLDVDRLVWVTSSTEANDRIKAEPLYKKLKVSQDKRDLFVPYQDPDIGAAFSFNTVLSIPYAIDEITPLLTAVK
ncbi:iron-siderophore ABC transporter substrate-binding protein [Streptomyces resistomycificus]|uniref:Iron ABC transporter substrate-binding protein n=1 Tax=Streptomyces resistomycificus TaxID=67356 RepID=A0A0L8LZK8_9ACTN|nr:iron-siderophore ABC transporter substrate-binding protein [Streptomyces resistomycificus]KOG43617.1 iron ABC transporter substrate-binding protein [Streptomyces resistomycificus]KUO00189.1 iron ABC transporter substrate-binding protein [Streptomyces resistomycificus]